MAPRQPAPPAASKPQKKALGERFRELLFVQPKPKSTSLIPEPTIAWYNRPKTAVLSGSAFSYTDNKWLVGGEADVLVEPERLVESATLSTPSVTTVCETSASGDMVGISIQGASHLAHNIPCQDRFAAWAEDDSGCIVACDGAGFEGYAKTGQGARILSSTLAQFVRDRQNTLRAHWHGDLTAIIGAAIEGAISIMMSQPYVTPDNLTIEDFSCTLVGVYWCELGHVTFHIGDGLVIVGEDQPDSALGTKLHLSHPRNGQFSNETFFFPTYRDDLRVAFGPPISFALVMSDGVQDLTYSARTGGVHPGFLNPLLHRYSQKGAVWLRDQLFKVLFNDGANAVSSDDKTLVAYFAKPFSLLQPGTQNLEKQP
jgi:Protein phosphatase 2C